MRTILMLSQAMGSRWPWVTEVKVEALWKAVLGTQIARQVCPSMANAGDRVHILLGAKPTGPSLN